jgi:hypothetical protein
MHFPDSKLPPVVPATDRAEITPKAPIRPARKVVPGFPEAMAESGEQPPTKHEAAAEPEEQRPEPPPYAGEDRRLMCRRIYHVPVLLDTRTGEERRKSGDSGEVPPTHMDRIV